MESYTFYFDESFHDRKIRIDEQGHFNILREDALIIILECFGVALALK